ncbi:hypothetical protein J4464_04680 [Candidatus Woesearchaeota archaeon]|nr:hypothetical protein [Candidatus Woesearchaeota archaeon]
MMETNPDYITSLQQLRDSYAAQSSMHRTKKWAFGIGCVTLLADWFARLTTGYSVADYIGDHTGIPSLFIEVGEIAGYFGFANLSLKHRNEQAKNQALAQSTEATLISLETIAEKERAMITQNQQVRELVNSIDEAISNHLIYLAQTRPTFNQ